MKPRFKPLATEFTAKGFLHRQVKREGLVAIYERQHVDLGGKDLHYEVVAIKESPERVMGGVTIEARETYPSSEVWGLYGFTCPDSASAHKKFVSLLP